MARSPPAEKAPFAPSRTTARTSARDFSSCTRAARASPELGAHGVLAVCIVEGEAGDVLGDLEMDGDGHEHRNRTRAVGSQARRAQAAANLSAQARTEEDGAHYVLHRDVAQREREERRAPRGWGSCRAIAAGRGRGRKSDRTRPWMPRSHSSLARTASCPWSGGGGERSRARRSRARGALQRGDGGGEVLVAAEGLHALVEEGVAGEEPAFGGTCSATRSRSGRARARRGRCGRARDSAPVEGLELRGRRVAPEQVLVEADREAVAQRARGAPGAVHAQALGRRGARRRPRDPRGGASPARALTRPSAAKASTSGA